MPSHYFQIAALIPIECSWNIKIMSETSFRVSHAGVGNLVAVKSCVFIMLALGVMVSGSDDVIPPFTNSLTSLSQS